MVHACMPRALQSNRKTYWDEGCSKEAVRREQWWHSSLNADWQSHACHLLPIFQNWYRGKPSVPLAPAMKVPAAGLKRLALRRMTSILPRKISTLYSLISHSSLLQLQARMRKSQAAEKSWVDSEYSQPACRTASFTYCILGLILPFIQHRRNNCETVLERWLHS